MCRNKNLIEIIFISSLFAIIVVGFICICFWSYGNNCSPLHETDMRTCLNDYTSSLTFLMEGDSLSTILDSWPYVKQACERFPYLEGCLTESIIDNCLTFKQMYNPFSYSSHSTLALIYHGANFVCQDGYEAIKNCVMCATKHCRINQKNCSTIETSINKCSDTTKKICEHQKYNIFHLFLRLRECSKAPNCHFCKQANEDLYGILDRWFKRGNEEIQLTDLKEIHNDLSEVRPQIKIYIEIGIVPVLIQCLDSFNTSIQFEAISCLQKLGNSKIDHVEAIIDTGTLPQLVHRILTTESDEISGKIIEFFAILITIKPNLHEYYKNLKIVEPLVLSIFPETTSKKIKTKIATILSSISHENDWAPTLETRNTVEDLFPLLTELVNHHESEVLIDIIEGYIEYKQQKDDIKIYVTFEVFETLINFLGRNDSVFETLIFQVLEFIKANEKQIQPIFDAHLIPQILKNFDSFYLNIRKNAAELISKITINGNFKQLSILYENEIILKICNYLKETKSQKSSYYLLSAVYNFVIKLNEKSEEILTKFAAFGGYDFVQRLEKHKNLDLQEIASKLRHLIATGYNGNKSSNMKNEKEEL